MHLTGKKSIDEVWKPVVGYEGLYEVSSIGDIRSLFHGGSNRWKNAKYPRMMLPYVVRGHYALFLSCNGSQKSYCVNRLVLEALCGPCPIGYEAAHLNGKPLDNCFTNLVWCTHKENESHKIIHGTLLRGERCGNSILTEKQVLEIRGLFKHRKHGDTISTAIRFGCSEATIKDVGTRKSWKWLQGNNDG